MANPFLTPAKIISGKDALEAAGPALAALGKKALIVTDSMMIKLGNLDKVLKVLNQHHIAYSIDAEINSEPCDTMIVHGLKQYQAEHCDFLIALGGGSPIDSMKAIAMMSADPDRPLNSYMGQPVETPLPKKVAIPTTAGTGSEATQFTIITDTENDVKMLLKGGNLIPDLAIIDPQFTMTAPKGVTSATGIDALCHAIEAYTSRLAQPLSDTFALSAVKRIFNNLTEAGIIHIHLSNIDHTRKIILITEFPCFLGSYLHTGFSGNNDNSCIGCADCFFHFSDKIKISRRIKDINLCFFPFNRNQTCAK